LRPYLLPKTRRAAFYTLGCKVNRFESDGLAQKFRELGWETVSFKEPADLYLINTCTVTAEAQRQSLQMVRQAVRNHPEAVVGAVGCATRLFPEPFLEIPGLRFVGGCVNKMALPPLVVSLRPEHRTLYLPDEGTPPLEPLFPWPETRTRALLKIQEGCDGACSYCLVPRARGRSRSLPPEEVRRGLKHLSLMGVKEVVLTGIHLGQYGSDLERPTPLAALLKDLLDRHPELQIRLSSLEPQEVGPDLRDLFHSFPNLCRHLHIPLQSGDDGILKAMNRTYSSAFYREGILDLHQRFPTLSIGADLIIGFPGETEEAFSKTYEFVLKLPLSYLHLFPFSPRPGTPAATFPGQVPQKVKKERLRIFRELDRRKRREFIARCLGKTIWAIGLDGGDPQRGNRVLTENYLTVFVSERVEKNERVRLKLIGPDGEGIKGKIIEREGGGLQRIFLGTML
jgi:threonylcarbamoyladenosine tRNA methylthiotransferase MtaB